LWAREKTERREGGPSGGAMGNRENWEGIERNNMMVKRRD